MAELAETLDGSQATAPVNTGEATSPVVKETTEGATDTSASPAPAGEQAGVQETPIEKELRNLKELDGRRSNELGELRQKVSQFERERQQANIQSQKAGWEQIKELKVQEYYDAAREVEQQVAYLPPELQEAEARRLLYRRMDDFDRDLEGAAGQVRKEMAMTALDGFLSAPEVANLKVLRDEALAEMGRDPALRGRPELALMSVIVKKGGGLGQGLKLPEIPGGSKSPDREDGDGYVTSEERAKLDTFLGGDKRLLKGAVARLEKSRSARRPS